MGLGVSRCEHYRRAHRLEIDSITSSGDSPETERFGNPNAVHCSESTPVPQRIVRLGCQLGSDGERGLDEVLDGGQVVRKVTETLGQVEQIPIQRIGIKKFIAQIEPTVPTRYSLETIE